MLKLRAPRGVATDQLQDQEGQTAAEYGVVLGVITIGIVMTLSLLAVSVEGKLGAAIKIVTSAAPF